EWPDGNEFPPPQNSPGSFSSGRLRRAACFKISTTMRLSNRDSVPRTPISRAFALSLQAPYTYDPATIGIKVYDVPIFEIRPPHRTCPRLFSNESAMWRSAAINPPVAAPDSNHAHALWWSTWKGLVKMSS